MKGALVLSAAEAALFDSVVVPRYLQSFAAPAIPILIPSQPAIVAHLGCRTGYPATMMGHQLPGCMISGVDNSAAALEIASSTAGVASGFHATYLQADDYPTPLPAASFTHSLELHPLAQAGGDYRATFAEHARLLTGNGQMVMALPLRGSFPEIYDMLREYALRHDQPHFGEAVDAASSARPNPETVAEQIESVGFYEVEVGVDFMTIAFDSGREFLDDPIRRFVVGPDVQSSLATGVGIDAAWSYAAEAIAKYWSEIRFELTVNIGYVSARRIPG